MNIARRRLIITAVLVALALSFMMVRRTQIIEGWGLWYSADIQFRIQSNAFLNGKLSVQASPVNSYNDWAWTPSGMQQVWGLGVALLRAPLDAIASVFGLLVPDRFIFILFYFACVFCGFLILPKSDGENEVDDFLRRFGAVSLLFFSPAFTNLIAVGWYVYEEAVAYTCLCVLVVFMLMLRATVRSSKRYFFALALLSGLIIFFRPTSIVYGFGALLLAGWFGGYSWRSRARGLGIFSIGPILILILNKLRFGSPFEFGHNINLNSAVSDMFAKGFGAPWLDVPIGTKFIEMFQHLFQNLPVDSPLFYGFRWREVYFENFSYLSGLLFFFGILAAVFSKKKLLRVAVIWSLAAFSVLYVFYAQHTSITSRYISDFIPAVYAGIFCFAWLLFDFVPSAYRALPVAGCVLALSLWPTASHKASAVDVNYIKSMPITRAYPMPVLKSEYLCGQKDAKAGIFTNITGWDIEASCKVQAATVLFFENPNCIQLETVTVNPKAPDFLDEVRMKQGLFELERVVKQQTGSATKSIFCLKEKDLKNSPRGIQAILIGWVHYRRLGFDNDNRIILKSAKVVAHP